LCNKKYFHSRDLWRHVRDKHHGLPYNNQESPEDLSIHKTNSKFKKSRKNLKKSKCVDSDSKDTSGTRLMIGRSGTETTDISDETTVFYGDGDSDNK
jgi:hypothetical protein